METFERYKANRDAKFSPAGIDADGETRTLPCIEIGGAQVYAYVEDGKLIISAHLDEASGEVFELYGPDRCVPVVVTIGGGDPVFAALPDSKEI